MSNVIQLRQPKPVTVLSPESETLLQLCNHYAVSAMTFSHSGGAFMVIVYFYNYEDRTLNLYQKGDSASMDHLFFWVTCQEFDLVKFTFNASVCRDEVRHAMRFVFGDEWDIEE